MSLYEWNVAFIANNVDDLSRRRHMGPVYGLNLKSTETCIDRGKCVKYINKITF